MGFDVRSQGPRRIGRYDILRLIARGGMAEVFLGHAADESLGVQLVAIKRILPHLSDKEDFVKMFIDEARIVARLDHPSIARIYEFGIEFDRRGASEDSYFMVMEYVPGMDLRGIYEFFRTKKLFASPSMAAWVMARVCAALNAAHTQLGPHGTPLEIIHRDVSPSNVLVTFEGEVKLIDFGVAKAAQRLHETTGQGIKGKVAYMSPEQASGEPVDHRSDIFSAGTLLYELLTGRNPFRGDGELETLRRVQEARVTPPTMVFVGVPPQLEAICVRALARRPADRFPNAGQMQSELEEFCRRAGYGATQLGLWMAQSFPGEQEKLRSCLSGEIPAAAQEGERTARWTGTTGKLPRGAPSGALPEAETRIGKRVQDGVRQGGRGAGRRREVALIGAAGLLLAASVVVTIYALAGRKVAEPSVGRAASPKKVDPRSVAAKSRGGPDAGPVATGAPPSGAEDRADAGKPGRAISSRVPGRGVWSKRKTGNGSQEPAVKKAASSKSTKAGPRSEKVEF
jgi:serine/threonine-protein kinase